MERWLGGQELRVLAENQSSVSSTYLGWPIASSSQLFLLLWSLGTPVVTSTYLLVCTCIHIHTHTITQLKNKSKESRQFPKALGPTASVLPSTESSWKPTVRRCRRQRELPTPQEACRGVCQRAGFLFEVRPQRLPQSCNSYFIASQLG